MPPKTVLLMRHAEKPANQGSPDLTAAGRRRAAKLATYLPRTFGAPQFIFAASVQHSRRPLETMKPLARRLKIPINASFPAGKYKQLARLLLTERRYADSLVVVCWRHTALPQFAKALKARPKDYPGRWKSSVFNLILKMTYDGAVRPSLVRITEPF